MAAEAALEKVPERAAELLRLSAPQTLQLLTFRVGGTPDGEGARDSPLSGGEGQGVLPSFGAKAAETKRESVGSTSALHGIGVMPRGDGSSSDGEGVRGRVFLTREAGAEDERRAGSASFLFRIPDVVKALKQAQTPFWLHAYLRELFQACPEATRTYYSLQLRLFLRFAPHLLLSFLQTADGGYDYNEALAVCRCWTRVSADCREPHRRASRSSLSADVPGWSSATPRQPPAILHCEAFLLGRLGRYGEAINLLLEELADVPAAVALAWESASRRVWEMLVQAVVQRPCYITELLAALEDHLAAFSAYTRANGAASGDPETLDGTLPFGSMSRRDEGGHSLSLDVFSRVSSQSRPKKGEVQSFFGVGENERAKKPESTGLRPELTPEKGHLPLSVEPMSPLSRGDEGVGEPSEPLGVGGPEEGSRRGLGRSSRRACVSPLSPPTCRETMEATAAEAARAAAAIAPLELLKRLPSHALRLVPRLERRLALLFEQRQLCDEFWEAAEQCQEDDLRSLTSELFVRRRRGVAVCPRPACGLSAGQTDPVSAHRVRGEKRQDSERQKTRQLLEAIRKRLKEVRGELDEGESPGQVSEPQRDAGGDGDDVGGGHGAQGLRVDGDRGSGYGAETLVSGHRGGPQVLRSSTCARESNDPTRGLKAEDDSTGLVGSAAGATRTGRDSESSHGQGSGDSGRVETNGERHEKADEKRKRHQSLLRSFLLPGGSSGRGRKQSSASRWLWGSGSPPAGERGRLAEGALEPLREERERGDTSQGETGSEETKGWSRRVSRGGEMMKAAPSGLGAAMIAGPDETRPATGRDREDGESTDETKKIQWHRGGEKPQGEKAFFSQEMRRARGLLHDFRETDETGRQSTEPFLFLPPATRCVICMRFVGSPPGCRVEWRCSPSLAPQGAALALPAVSEVSPGVSASPSRGLLSLAPSRDPAWDSPWSGGPFSGRARRHRKHAVSAVAFFCGHTAHLACSLAAKEGDPEFPNSSRARPLVALGFRQLTSAPRCVSARWPGAGLSPRRARSRSLGRTLRVGTDESGDLAGTGASKAIEGRTHADAGTSGEEVNECEKGGDGLACPVCQQTPLTSWTAAWSCYGERRTEGFRENTRGRHSIERPGDCCLEEDSQLFSQVLGERENGKSFLDSLGRLPQAASLSNVASALW
ncbi:UNVERIFIED_CONTAM: hypothetical protein HHA_461620 [Hammondia hammondi]|eukprot:XP_008881811.1 hypothetical protein HHA_461620 [Hammondia hammondi]